VGLCESSYFLSHESWFYAKLVQHFVNLIKKEVSCFEEEGFFYSLPSPKLDPRWALVSKPVELWGLEGTLPTLSTKRGRRVCWSFGMGLRRGTSLSYLLELASNEPISWLDTFCNTFGARTNHGQPWTHKTHHGPDSGEATTFPHIVFSTLLRGTYIWMAFCPETPKEEFRNYPCLDSRDFVGS